MLSFLFGWGDDSGAGSGDSKGIAEQAAEKAGSGGAERAEPEYALHAVAVTGFEGSGARLNGEYRATGKWLDSRPVYRKVGRNGALGTSAEGLCLWYCAGAWRLGFGKNVGTEAALASARHDSRRVWMSGDARWNVSSDARASASPEKKSTGAGSSQKAENKKTNAKRETPTTASASSTPTPTAATAAATTTAPDARVAPLIPARVLGADGGNSRLNGAYSLRRDLAVLPRSLRARFQDRPVFRLAPSTTPRDGADRPPARAIWCCDRGWCIGLDSDVGSKQCYAASDERCALPWLATSPWKVVRSGGGGHYWADRSNLRVVPESEVLVSSCPGGPAADGVYALRRDWTALPFFAASTFRGRPVYQQVDGDHCLWFSSARGWCIGKRSDVGTEECVAYSASRAATPWLLDQPWLAPTGQGRPTRGEDEAKTKAQEGAPATCVTPCVAGPKLRRKWRRRVAESRADARAKALGRGVEAAEQAEEAARGAVARAVDAYVAAAYKLGFSRAAAEERVLASEGGSAESKALCARVELLAAVAKRKRDLAGATSRVVAARQAHQAAAKRATQASRDAAASPVKLSSARIEAFSSESKGRKESVPSGDGGSPPSSPTRRVTTRRTQQGIMPELPLPMVRDLDAALRSQIAEAERKLSAGPSLADQISPLPLLRAVPVVGQLVAMVAPAVKAEAVHEFEPGRFDRPSSSS